VHAVSPSFRVIADTQINQTNLRLMLADMGAPEGYADREKSASDGEHLIEIAGRMCYKSFGTGLNKNLSKVREGTRPYIGNILKTKHGSVLEHSSTTVAFLNVSRIFTHEICRHRAGAAFSQESMRFVRLDDIPIWIPDLTADFEALATVTRDPGETREPATSAKALQAAFERYMRDVTEYAERAITSVSRVLDDSRVPFGIKKSITSALRRMAPGGHATNIVATANHRAWRHWLELRTALTPNGDRTAEVEIHDVFVKLGDDFKMRYPHIYQDMTVVKHETTGIYSCVFENSKV